MTPVVGSMSPSRQWRMGFITGQGHPGSKLQACSVLDKITYMISSTPYKSVLYADLLPSQTLWVMAQALSSLGLCSPFTNHKRKLWTCRLGRNKETKSRIVPFFGQRSFLCFAWLVLVQFWRHMSGVLVKG